MKDIAKTLAEKNQFTHFRLSKMPGESSNPVISLRLVVLPMNGVLVNWYRVMFAARKHKPGPVFF